MVSREGEGKDRVNIDDGGREGMYVLTNEVVLGAILLSKAKFRSV